MKNFWHRLYAKQSFFYKILLCVAITCSIVYFFPKGVKFKYEFQQGKLWQYETLYAPFEFSLKKSAEQIAKEKQAIKDQSLVYYSKDTTAYQNVLDNYQREILVYVNELPVDLRTRLIEKGKQFLFNTYQKGVITSADEIENKNMALIEGNEIVEQKVDELFSIRNLKNEILAYFKTKPYSDYIDVYHAVFFEVMKPNIAVNEYFTKKTLEQNLDQLVYSRGIVKKNQLIITKGEIVQAEKLEMLQSLQTEYESEHWNTEDNTPTYIGYLLLVAVTLFIIVLYLNRFYPEIYHNNTSLTFILTNVLLMVVLTSLALKIDVNYMYATPICILPLLCRAFFDIRLGIFIYTMTVLIIGFVVPNSFQFIFISIVAGSFSMLNIRELHYRVNLFLTAGHITLVYVLTYIIYSALSEGSWLSFDTKIIGFFILNGFLTLFVQPLTYIYEKLFGLVSNVSLLELSDTNSKLLRELSEKAPGTFHHSLQVANLAEAAASEIGANTMLVRVGALYHDIGKMNNPMYFTENQKTSVNPHDELTPLESAKIIINHVIEGIEMARQNNIPDRIIDFIRTHHGNSLVYYFYKQQLDSGEPFDEADFHYKGPIPFSKETVILMMADSIEAASKSLKNPTYEAIENFVESIIRKQYEEKQYMNTDITLKEIEKIKKILKEKLVNIYHLRIEYPE